MPEPGAISALITTCQRVVDPLPAAEVAAARQRASAAMAAVVATGPSANHKFRVAAAELTALVADLDSLTADLAAAAEHVRAFQGLLG